MAFCAPPTRFRRSKLALSLRLSSLSWWSTPSSSRRARSTSCVWSPRGLVGGPFQIKYIPLCGHWVQQEQPEVVNGHLLDFLADLSPGIRAQPIADRGAHDEAGGLEP
jgi:hypothetical protein